MGMLITILAALSVQDAEARYREALYHEVDKGDLDRAAELFRKVESDAAATEDVRARAAFRAAWCLEKKGQKAEAEKAYRDLAARYPGQAETVAKARERLDRLLTGGTGPGQTRTLDELVADHILALGSQRPETADIARRALVLIGKPAVPTLRQALAHRDVLLSAMAAVVLVEMGEDEGAFAPLVRGLKLPAASVSGALAALLARRPDLSGEFVEAMKQEKAIVVLERYLYVLYVTPVPQARDHLRHLIVHGPEGHVQSTERALRISTEDELLKLLSDLASVESGKERAMTLMAVVRGVRITGPAAFARALLAHWPEPESGILEAGRRFPGWLQVLHEIAPEWLDKASPQNSAHLIKHIGDWGPNGFDLIFALLKKKPKPEVGRGLISLLGGLGRSSRGPMHPLVESTLWSIFDTEAEPLKDAAGESLLNLLPESDPRWEDPVRAELEQPAYTEILELSRAGRPPEIRCSLDQRYRTWSAETRQRVRRLVYRKLGQGDSQGRFRALDLIDQFRNTVSGHPAPEDEFFEGLCLSAADESLGDDLRVVVVRRLPQPQDSSLKPEVLERARSTLLALLKDRTAKVRAAAAQKAKLWRHPRSDQALAPLVEDPEPAVAMEAVRYFGALPREDLLDPLIRALKSRDARVRQAGAEGLGISESLKAVPPLIPLLDDPDATVRAKVREALDRIRKRYDEKAQWVEWYERVRPKDK